MSAALTFTPAAPASHQRVGTRYLLFALAMLMAGGALALVMRAELFGPGLQFVNPERFNQLVALHGIVMVFGAIMPAGVGFAIWMIPLQIGARDMVFPRLNAASFWLLAAAALLLVAALFMPSRAPAAGWTLYTPLLPPQTGLRPDAALYAMLVFCASFSASAVNIIVTVLARRTPGMPLRAMPMFCWAWLATACLLVVVMPVLAGSIALALADRHFETHFWGMDGGGDLTPVQNIFWFFSHPEVYVMLLPAFGIISQVVPAFARKKLFGRSAMVYATWAIAVLSLTGWAYHLFAAHLPVAGQLFFMYAAMLVAVPAAVQVFNWAATLWQGSMSFEPPMLFAVGFIFMFTLGGFSGLLLSALPLGAQAQDTYYAVAHSHYMLVAGALFALLAGYYYWAPRCSGVMYSQVRAKIHFWWSLISLNVTFFPMYFLGLAGMPRRVADYPMQFADFNAAASAGAFFFGFGQIYFLIFIVLPTLRGKGEKVSQKPWDGAGGLEWAPPSPPAGSA